VDTEVTEKKEEFVDAGDAEVKEKKEGGMGC
jgi:hypothetical protein